MCVCVCVCVRVCVRVSDVVGFTIPSNSYYENVIVTIVTSYPKY